MSSEETFRERVQLHVKRAALPASPFYGLSQTCEPSQRFMNGLPHPRPHIGPHPIEDMVHPSHAEDLYAFTEVVVLTTYDPELDMGSLPDVFRTHDSPSRDTRRRGQITECRGIVFTSIAGRRPRVLSLAHPFSSTPS